MRPPNIEQRKIEQPQVSDAQLLCYYWNDGLSALEFSQISSRLLQDAALAARFAVLQAELHQLKQTDEHALSSAAALRIRRALAARAAAPKPAALANWRWAAPLLAASVVAIWFVFKPAASLMQDTELAGVVSAKAADFARKDQMLRALQVHLSDSQILLENFNPDDAASTELLNEIIAQNQSFERRARAQGQGDLARVLRAMEPVLRALSNEREGDLRDNLIEQFEFEAKSLQTKLPMRPSKQASTQDAPTAI